MFKCGFKEGEEQTANLELVDGVVSVRAFEILAQWLCIGRDVLKEYTSRKSTPGKATLKEYAPKESITALIEFSRLAGMCGIIGMEAQAAAHIRDVIRAGPAPLSRGIEKNTHYNTSAHII